MIPFREILTQQVHSDFSDTHFVAGEPPFFRVKNGDLLPINGAPILSKNEVFELQKEIAKAAGVDFDPQKKEHDLALELENVSRFRVTFYEETRGPAIAIREIPFEIPSPEALEIPQPLIERSLRRDGLILVTGPTGSGKSTTMASLIENINQNRACHIVTIEDPIEFTFSRKKAVISQRAVGVNTGSFGDAIKNAVRQDVDVLVVGEMRDRETIQTALTLAETGHLVLATLHTHDAPRTIQRIVDVFPAERQEQVALQLSHALAAVCSQRLLPKKDGNGRVCVRELMLTNSGVRHAIRTRKISELYSQITINREIGMRSFDDHLAEFVRAEEVDLALAMQAAHDPRALNERLTN